MTRGVDIATSAGRTRVYVDGFNFYYAAFRRGGFAAFKWLDIVRFCDVALPRSDVELVRFFTARLHPTHGRVAQVARQDAYLAALESLDRLTIHYGEFVERTRRRRLVNAPEGGAAEAEVWIAEEKGSDVNLASHLLLDAFRSDFDVAVVVSNDTDLLEPVRMVREDLGKPVGVLRVEGGQRRCVFSGRVDFIRTVRRGHFAAARLPDQLSDSSGRAIVRPSEW